LSSREFCQQYSLSHELRFQYINHTDSIRVPKIDDVKEMRDTLHAMDIMGLSKEDQYNIFSLLAGILHLGNVQFGDKNNYATVLSERDLQAPCAYFGIGIDYLKTKLISKRLEFKEQEGMKQVDQTFTVDKAIFTRDALAKSIYARIFDYLIQIINSAFKTTTRSDLTVCILDIYGFEIFEKNSFEQFCINYVNEKLQQIFIELTLKKEQEEYKRENIQWSPISFFNNIVVCDLFEAKQPPGMFLLLDDICASSHATTEKVDKSYLHKLSSLSNQHLIVSPPTFTVKHYAGAVSYHSDQFCEKNRDVLNIDLIEMMQSSTISFVARLFPEQTATIKARPTTAGTKIRNQANLLVEKLMGCQPHYVRCIKPNENQAPGEWNSSSVIEQVKYLGLVANIEVRKAGFVYRREFAKFLNRYAILTKETWPKWNGKVTDGVMHIVDSMHLDRREVQLGNTKVFIKSPESLHLLEDMRLRKFDNYARVIQKAMKRFCAVRVYQRQREQATDILYDRKERNARSLDRDYLGDYCNLHLRPDLQRLIPRNEKTDFSSYLYKYDRRFRRQGRFFISTNQALYIIDEECIKVGGGKGNGSNAQKGKQQQQQQQGYTLEYKVKRRIPLESITEIKLSEYRDNFFLLCVNNDYATLLELSSKTEAISTLVKNYRKKTNHDLPITFGKGFDYTVKKQGWMGGGTRSVKFTHATTAAPMNQIDPKKLGKGTDMPRDYEIKLNRSTMTVTISSGLSKKSRPNQANAEKPRGLQFKPQNAYTTRKPPDKPPRPLAAKPSKQKKLRALYDFEARSADELSFRTDNELLLIDNSDETWWKAELNGKTGVVPSNYVELIV
jgi:myosin-1